MTNVILVRHAQTSWNQSRRIQGGDSDTAGSMPVSRPTSVMEQISVFLEQWTDELRPSKTELTKSMKAGKDVIERALAVLERELYIRIDVNGTGVRAARRLVSLKPYRQAMDPRSDVFAGSYDLAPFMGE